MLERERLSQELDRVRADLRGSSGFAVEVAGLQSQLEAVTAERDQLSHSLYL